MEFNDKEIVAKAMDVSKCDSCGANLKFSPGKMSLECCRCKSTKQVRDTGPAKNLPLSVLAQNNSWQRETQVYNCQNCGAQTVLEKDELATSCPFCGTPNIVKSEQGSGLKPNAVVPFRFDADKASSIAEAWIKKRFFAPDAFKKSVLPEEIKGVYNPVFTFNAQTASKYSGTLVEYKYETKTDKDGKTEIKRIENRFNVNGTTSQNFADILIQASIAINQRSIDRIGPFDLINSREYTRDYLFGYIASQFNKNGEVCWNESRSIMDGRIRQAVLSKYRHDEVVRLNIDTRIDNPSFKYNLVPVYVGNCNYKDKLYNFYINGMNGRIDGKAPVSGIKVFLTIFFPLGLTVLAVKGFIGLFRRKKK